MAALRSTHWNFPAEAIEDLHSKYILYREKALAIALMSVLILQGKNSETFLV